MPVSPGEFLVLTIVTGFSFILTTLLIYLWLPCPCQPKCPSFKKLKRKISTEEKEPMKSIQICQNCQCYGCSSVKPLPPIPRSPVIKGPQGHGFYTSGPWKIDTAMQDSSLAMMQLSQPNILIAEYFSATNGGGINPSSSSSLSNATHNEESHNNNPSSQYTSHLMNNMMLANSSSPAYWNDHEDGTTTTTHYSHHGEHEHNFNSDSYTLTTMASNDSLVDMDDVHYHETDADMMMMFM